MDIIKTAFTRRILRHTIAYHTNKAPERKIKMLKPSTVWTFIGKVPWQKGIEMGKDLVMYAAPIAITYGAGIIEKMVDKRVRKQMIDNE